MKEKLKRLSEYEWELDKNAREHMRVKARIIGNNYIIENVEDAAIEQLTNVACLPGIIEPVVGLPDMHWGYGLPMGAVSAFDVDEGVISSGLCGFDINCGVNTIRTNLTTTELRVKLKELVPLLFNTIPSGVGAKGKLRLNTNQLDEVLRDGVDWALRNGYGTKEDKEATEELGCMKGGDPSKVSSTAKQRGLSQLGTLGAGNHFLELQRVTDVFDEKLAKKWGLKKDQVVVMLHCGSRGLGHQVASDYLKIQEKAVEKYNIWLPDRQLACAPATSKEGEDYFSAMKCAVNYSFTNRLVMTHWIRETFEKVFKRKWQELDMHTIYAVCHNVVKLEEHIIDGKKRKVYVHRKGATRAFPGQPVLVAGTMGTASYILVGTEMAMKKTFGSSVHGAGRVMSRNEALKKYRGTEIQKALEGKGEVVRATHPSSLAEEAPGAYKDVENVVDSVHNSGISTKVVRLEPLGVMKG